MRAFISTRHKRFCMNVRQITYKSYTRRGCPRRLRSRGRLSWQLRWQPWRRRATTTHAVDTIYLRTDIGVECLRVVAGERSWHNMSRIGRANGRFPSGEKEVRNRQFNFSNIFGIVCKDRIRRNTGFP